MTRSTWLIWSRRSLRMVKSWLEVEYRGREWAYRLPRPWAALWLGTLGRNVPMGEKLDALTSLLEHVLHPDDFEDLMDMAFDQDSGFDMDELGELVAVLVEAGSARPYHVDSTLCGTVVEHWTAVRGRLVMSGVPDPLNSLPTMYALMDAVESMILEGCEDEKARSRYWTKTYAPPPGSRDAKKLPRGWDRDTEMAGFDSLL